MNLTQPLSAQERSPTQTMFRLARLVLPCLLLTLTHPAPAKEKSASQTPQNMKTYRVEKLYRDYLQRGKDSTHLPQYDKYFIVSGVLQKRYEGYLSAGANSSCEEMARLSPYDENENKYMQTLPEGKPFKAICSLNFSLNTDHIILSDCVFK